MVVEERARQVNSALKEWYELTGKTETTPNEIMQHLIDKGIYNRHKGAIARQLRDDLRELERNNKLDLIEGAYFIPKEQNKSWYFKKA